MSTIARHCRRHFNKTSLHLYMTSRNSSDLNLRYFSSGKKINFFPHATHNSHNLSTSTLLLVVNAEEEIILPLVRPTIDL